MPRFDVVADNFSPGVMTRWGVTLETLREHRPDVIFASLSGYGREGPGAALPANGATTEPMSGLSSIHGYEGERASNTGGLIPDPITGYDFAGAILAALHHRRRTGEGQRIDTCMLEAVAVQLGEHLMAHDADGRIAAPSGNRHPHVAPHGAYPAADGEWIAIAAETDAAWRRLAAHLGRPELGSDPRFASAAARKAHEDELDALLSDWSARPGRRGDGRVPRQAQRVRRARGAVPVPLRAAGTPAPGARLPPRGAHTGPGRSG